MTGIGLRLRGSLRWRLMVGTVVAIGIALALSGVTLAALFRAAMLRQFQDGLERQLDQILAHVDIDAQGALKFDARALSDPRWERPYSGLYWQIDRGESRGVMRSRSLWDVTLSLPQDTLADGRLHVHAGTGPRQAPLMMVERSLDAAPEGQWRAVVAGDARDIDVAAARFDRMLLLSLGVLLVLLTLAAWAQVAVGLAPLKALQGALVAVRQGRSARLEGRPPDELEPLVEEFNRVLQQRDEMVDRARQHAGNLAHALKTPLTVLGQAAAGPVTSDAHLSPLAALVAEQVGIMRRQVDWHLAHARALAAQQRPGQCTAIGPVLDGLLRVMRRVHEGLELRCAPVPAAWAFAGAEQDLHQILGNVIDNACAWARSGVRIEVQRAVDEGGRFLQVRIDDDGPGIEVERRAQVLDRGVRLDESVQGSGLGLAIVADLVGVYGGDVGLEASPADGLRVVLRLPYAEAPSAAQA